MLAKLGITTFFLLAGLALVGAAMLLGTLVSGGYSYEYRCTDGVKESRLIVWGIAPFGGYEPIDGDPAGACDA